MTGSPNCVDVVANRLTVANFTDLAVVLLRSGLSGVADALARRRRLLLFVYC